jgi:hypothetical protein
VSAPKTKKHYLGGRAIASELNASARPIYKRKKKKESINLSIEKAITMMQSRGSWEKNQTRN